jgi:hypothetical protein
MGGLEKYRDLNWVRVAGIRDSCPGTPRGLGVGGVDTTDERWPRGGDI